MRFRAHRPAKPIDIGHAKFARDNRASWRVIHSLGRLHNVGTFRLALAGSEHG